MTPLSAQGSEVIIENPFIKQSGKHDLKDLLLVVRELKMRSLTGNARTIISLCVCVVYM